MNILHRHILLFGLLFLISFQAVSQRATEQWKAQISIGVNNPIENDQNGDYFSKYINFPTVNLGIQHMFSEQLGAKLDFGFNRSSNDDESPEFKLNYSRVNAQIVYNFSEILSFLPERISVVGHAGPGVTFTQPLGNFSENKYTYLNVLGGFEVHYALSDTFSVYSDFGYALSLSGAEDYDVNVDGFSFNGYLIYISFGVSFSLSGCQYC